MCVVCKRLKASDDNANGLCSLCYALKDVNPGDPPHNVNGILYILSKTRRPNFACTMVTDGVQCVMKRNSTKKLYCAAHESAKEPRNQHIAWDENGPKCQVYKGTRYVRIGVKKIKKKACIGDDDLCENAAKGGGYCDKHLSEYESD